MNSILKFSLAIFLLTQFSSCYVDRENIVPDLNEWGLTGDISNIVTDEIVENMIDLGMPIFGGDTPPDFRDESYFISPLILIASTRSQDEIGKKFADNELVLSGYDPDEMTINVNMKTSSTEAIGAGSFLVGEGNNFSIFTALYSYDSEDGSKATSVRVISGQISQTGITDLHLSLFLTDDFGDENDDLIEIGDGRIFYDSDGFSPAI